MSDNYLILEESKLNTSYLDGSIYKTYITHFFSYTKARHKIQCLYDSGDYALCDGTPYGCKRYTKLIVDDLIKQVYESD